MSASSVNSYCVFLHFIDTTSVTLVLGVYFPVFTQWIFSIQVVVPCSTLSGLFCNCTQLLWYIYATWRCIDTEQLILMVYVFESLIMHCLFSVVSVCLKSSCWLPWVTLPIVTLSEALVLCLSGLLNLADRVECCFGKHCQQQFGLLCLPWVWPVNVNGARGGEPVCLQQTLMNYFIWRL